MYFNELSMNNQECKVRPQTVNVNSDEHAFFRFSIKISKCSGSCNNINEPYAKPWAFNQSIQSNVKN